jgi:hypothetical protein
MHWSLLRLSVSVLMISMSVFEVFVGSARVTMTLRLAMATESPVVHSIVDWH